jgi:hypothetical protein
MELCGDLKRDMNSDGVQSITDVWLAAKWIFFWPGNATANYFSGYPQLASFFEITPATCGGLFVLIMSSLFWLITITLINAWGDYWDRR